MRLKLIACEIFYRELCAAVARSVNQVDVEFLPKGLHDIGQAGMSARLGEALAAVDPSKYEAVLLGYGLCSNGLVGLAARTSPWSFPAPTIASRLFLGSKERYLEYFHAHPGVYFKTSGWIERGEGLTQYQSGLDPAAVGHDADLRGAGGQVRRGQRQVPLRAALRHDAELQRDDVHRDGHRAGRPFRAAGARGGGRAGLEVREARRRHDADPAIGRRPLGRRPLSGGAARQPRGGQF